MRRSATEAAGELCRESVEPFDHKQRLTLWVIGALVASVICFRVDIMVGAFVGAVVLSLLKAADEEQAIKAIPWGVILMVSGVTVLIALMEKTGGMDLFTSHPGALFHAGNGDWHDCVCDWSHFRVQQHLGRGLACISACDPRSHCETGRR